MKQELIHTKVKTILRKLPHTKNKWRILLEAWPVFKEGLLEPTTVTDDPNIIVTTPIFEDTPYRVQGGQEIYQVKRDEQGLIMCLSDIDKAACMYADQIRKIRQSQYDKDKIYTKEERRLMAKFSAGEQSFLNYFEDGIKRFHPNGTKSVFNNWARTLELFRRFTNNKPVAFKDLNIELCNNFKYYLISREKEARGKTPGTLSTSTISQYISVFKAVLKQAFVEDYLSTNLSEQFKGVCVKQAKRETLSMEELELLGSTPCPRPIVKRAALFTALTGLRHCDVATMKWSQLKEASDGWRLDLVQQKTGTPAYLPISKQAYSLCGKPTKPELLVFADLPKVSECNRTIIRWMKAAGIDRHVTYHCFRHSFATLLLQQGVNLFTIKQLLGHTRVTTTEVYSHIVDSSKVQAAEAIVLDTGKKKRKTVKKNQK